MACAICHVYVDLAWVEKTGPRKSGKVDLLEFAASERRPESRLSCQIEIRSALDGLILNLADTQI